jgi:hypothetical protein
MFGNNNPYSKLTEEKEKKKSPKPDPKMSSGSLFTKVDDKPYDGKFKKKCKLIFMFGNNNPYSKLTEEKETEKSPKPDLKMSSGSSFTKVDDKPYDGKFKKKCKLKFILLLASAVTLAHAFAFLRTSSVCSNKQSSLVFLPI